MEAGKRATSSVRVITLSAKNIQLAVTGKVGKWALSLG